MPQPKRKKTKVLTQEEIWDDSALINSWNEALEEYKLYHSIAARGENVRDVLKSAAGYESDLNDAEVEDTNLNGHATTSTGQHTAQDDDQEDGEINDDDENVEGEKVSSVLQTASAHHAQTASAGPSNVPYQSNITDQQTSAAGMPQAILQGVQDEGLKNLMMSWYYAGYYTGLFEGQQKARHAT